jgi:hypothetical protein
MLSEAYRGEAMIKPSVSERHKYFKESREKVEHNEDNSYHFSRYQGHYCSFSLHSIRLYSQPSLLPGNV